MSLKRSSSWKVCVTCERWGGERKLSPFRDYAEYADNNERGECIGGLWDGKQVQALPRAARFSADEAFE